MKPSLKVFHEEKLSKETFENIYQLLHEAIGSSCSDFHDIMDLIREKEAFDYDLGYAHALHDHNIKDKV